MAFILSSTDTGLQNHGLGTRLLHPSRPRAFYKPSRLHLIFGLFLAPGAGRLPTGWCVYAVHSCFPYVTQPSLPTNSCHTITPDTGVNPEDTGSKMKQLLPSRSLQANGEDEHNKQVELHMVSVWKNVLKYENKPFPACRILR